MKTPYKLVLLFSLNFLNPGISTAQSGVLDSMFGASGIVTQNISGTSSDYPTSIAQQPDGKLLVAGTTFSGNSAEIILLRYNLDGTPDDDFGIGGIAKADFGTTKTYGYAIAIQPDAKILVGGFASISNNSDFAVIRFLSDGSPDSTFGTAGMVTTDLGASFEGANAMALQADGKIVLAGYTAAVTLTASDFAVARYTPEGVLDTTFGGGIGFVITSIKDEDNAQAVAIQPDGKIVLAGFASLTAIGDYALVRYNTDGSPDTDFGVGGKVTTDMANLGYSDLATSLLLLPSGKILVAGISNYSNLIGSADVGLVQYNEDGTFDDAFGTDGIINHVLGYSNFVHDMARQPDGKILVIGKSDVANGENRWSMFRFHPNGDLDSGFGDNGVVTTAMAGTIENATSVLIQHDSKIVLTGRVGDFSNFDIALARYIADFNLSATVEQGISCYGEADAIISVNVSGGVPPYQYSIDGVNFQSGNVFTGLPAGTYTITVLDSNGDGVMGSVSSIVVSDVPAPPAVTLNVVTNVITVNVAGSGTYQYSNDGGLSFQSGNVFPDLANGTYPVVVQDENGCVIFSETVVIDIIGLKDVSDALTFELSPNPGDGFFRLKMYTPAPAVLQLRISDLSGKQVYVSTLTCNGVLEESFDLRALENGSYDLWIGNENQWAAKKLLIAK